MKGVDIVSENNYMDTSYIEDLNKRLAQAGLPQFIVKNGFVYKDELHEVLGIGIKLKDEES